MALCFDLGYYFDTDNQSVKRLRNEYVLVDILAGTAQMIDREDHVEMQDASGGLFHDEIRSVNDSIPIGKYYSTESSVGCHEVRAFYSPMR